MVGGLISAPETGTNITDRLELIYTSYVEYVLISPSDIIVIIDMDIRKYPLPIRVTSD